jgi:DNA-binding XRE family transcriptional regulator
MRRSSRCRALDHLTCSDSASIPKTESTQNITHTLWLICDILAVRTSLDVQLAKYLRKARGELSYAQFSKKIGVSHMTLHRLEHGEHHLTLNKLETVMTKLKIRLSDIFPDEY